LQRSIFAGPKGFLLDGCPRHLWAELSSARRNALRASLRQIGRAMLTLGLLASYDDAYAIANDYLDHHPLAAVSLFPGGVWMPEISALRKDPHFQTFAQRMRVINYWKPCGHECDLYGDGVACR